MSGIFTIFHRWVSGPKQYFKAMAKRVRGKSAQIRADYNCAAPLARWLGRGALRLGLYKLTPVRPKMIEQLLNLKDPWTGSRLYKTTNPQLILLENVLTLPKGASIVVNLVVGECPQLVEDLREIAADFFNELEELVMVRDRRGSKKSRTMNEMEDDLKNSHYTKNAIAALFTEFHNRLGQPGFHHHLLTFKPTWDEERERYLSLDARKMSPPPEEIAERYSSRVRNLFETYGFRTRQGRHSWELEMITDEQIDACSGRAREIKDEMENLRNKYAKIRKRQKKGKRLTDYQQKLYQALNPDNEYLDEPDPRALRAVAFSKTRNPKVYFTHEQIRERMETDLGPQVVAKLEAAVLATFEATLKPQPIIERVSEPADSPALPEPPVPESESQASSADSTTEHTIPIMEVRFRLGPKPDEEPDDNTTTNAHEDREFVERVRFLQRVLLHMQRIQEIEEKILFAKKLAKHKKYSSRFFEAMKAAEGRWHQPLLTGLQIHGEALRSFVRDEQVRTQTTAPPNPYAALRKLSFPELQKLRKTDPTAGQFLETAQGKKIHYDFLKTVLKPADIPVDIDINSTPGVS